MTTGETKRDMLNEMMADLMESKSSAISEETIMKFYIRALDLLSKQASSDINKPENKKVEEETSNVYPLASFTEGNGSKINIMIRITD